jgi:hypothetical protein
MGWGCTAAPAFVACGSGAYAARRGRMSAKSECCSWSCSMRLFISFMELPYWCRCAHRRLPRLGSSQIMVPTWGRAVPRFPIRPRKGRPSSIEGGASTKVSAEPSSRLYSFCRSRRARLRGRPPISANGCATAAAAKASTRLWAKPTIMATRAPLAPAQHHLSRGLRTWWSRLGAKALRVARRRATKR